jgi:citronellol/citronellal dehydrogenase
LNAIHDETAVAHPDVCINSASAIDFSGNEAPEIKRYDLMHDINTRGTFVVCATTSRDLRT